MKRDLAKIFIDEIYKTPPRENSPTKKITSNYTAEICSFLLDVNDYNTSNNGGSGFF